MLLLGKKKKRHPHLFSSKALFLCFGAAGSTSLIYGTERKMSSGRNANGNGACRLVVVKCMARVRETPSSVGSTSVLCMHESKKKKKMADKKIKMAVKL